jgi:hypothetical protein
MGISTYGEFEVTTVHEKKNVLQKFREKLVDLKGEEIVTGSNTQREQNKAVRIGGNSSDERQQKRTGLLPRKYKQIQ